MFQVPGHNKILSMRLSKVLEDIGVDEKIVLKRRRTWLLLEAVHNETNSIATAKNDIQNRKQVYYLGSQSESTTTPGLKSDIDQLICYQTSNVIQDLNEWVPNVKIYLMIQDENVSPGYCLLQLLREDASLPYDTVPNEYHFKDRLGRVLFSSNFMAPQVANRQRVIKGPAYTKEGRHGGGDDIDSVVAFQCKSWPVKARFKLEEEHRWPSEDMRRYFATTGCFVVPVGSKGSEYEQFEWRISTSLAERCLMFNLNITQIRCYILMKMILKTFINPYFNDTISSYMCKTSLLHSISNTHYNLWIEKNLYFCLMVTLAELYDCIRNENCPHFFIPENNLMRGEISPEVKPFLLGKLQYVIKRHISALLKIKSDSFGSRLYLMSFSLRPFKTNVAVSGNLLKKIANYLNEYMKNVRALINKNNRLSIQILTNTLLKLVQRLSQSQGFRQAACRMITPWLCTTIGSILASRNIQEHDAISAEAFTWISLGLKTDIASSKLKLASMLYSIGEMHKAEIVLREIERQYDLNMVETVCGCYEYNITSLKKGFIEMTYNHNEEVLQSITAFCVCFIPCEINCVPKELRYEMFRSTQEDRAFRGIHDQWMDFIVVDSLTYLYFLQYKTCSHLGKDFHKQRTLFNLIKTIDKEPNLGHRETALNLLGQCMEKEGKVRNAVKCYMQSLHVRGRNNAAKLHLCILLNTLLNGSQ